MDYVIANQEPTKGAAPVSAGLGSIVRIPVPGPAAWHRVPSAWLDTEDWMDQLALHSGS